MQGFTDYIITEVQALRIEMGCVIEEHSKIRPINHSGNGIRFVLTSGDHDFLDLDENGLLLQKKIFKKVTKIMGLIETLLIDVLIVT